MAQVHTDGKHSLFLHEQLAHSHWKYTDEGSNIAFNEDIMENNYMFVMIWNLSVFSHWIFPQCFFFISGAISTQSFENAGVAFVKGADERNKLLETRGP